MILVDFVTLVTLIYFYILYILFFNLLTDRAREQSARLYSHCVLESLLPTQLKQQTTQKKRDQIFQLNEKRTKNEKPKKKQQ